MRHHLHLATLTLLLGATTTHAQITNPDTLIGKPPAPPTHARVSLTTDLQWLWQYTQPAPQGNEEGLLKDPRFTDLLKDNLKASQSFFRDGTLPLAEVAHRYFGMIFSSVRGIGNRYITFNSCVPHDCTSHGLLWVDTAPQHPTVVFAATEWTTQGKSVIDPDAEYYLWIFSSRPLDPEHPPATLVAAIADWNGTQPQHIKRALLIDPDGTLHTVVPATLGATPTETK
jgi:hypothetical protein